MTEGRRKEPLRPGDFIPAFSGATDSGSVITNADLLGHRSILFFYPKAGSPGCSVESREFARHHAEFVAAGVTVVGVSVDPPEAQRTFRDACQLPFPLVADPDREISGRFGVLGALGMARRTTFLLGPDGRVLDVVRSWRPRYHADFALERLLGKRSEPGDSASATDARAP